MIIDIKEYIKLPRETRKAHVDMSESCIERGGNSTNHKGVLAQFLNTSIPSGRTLCCHACNNEKCSNPKHLYWGTDYENIMIDSVEAGVHKSIWDRTVEKYGYAEACAMNARRNKSAGGKAGKGKPKSPEHRAKIAASLLAKSASKKEEIPSCAVRKHQI